MSVLKERPKIWAIFILICIASYLLVFVCAQPLITGISKSIAISDYESQLEQENQETEDSELTEDQKEMQNVMDSAVGMLSSIMMYLGIVIIVFGMFNFLLSFTRDDHESALRSVSFLVVGATMIGAKYVLGMFFGG